MSDEKIKQEQIGRHETVRVVREKLLKEDHAQHIKRLTNYKRVLIETSEFIRSELPNIDYLIRLLEKMQKEKLSETSFNQYCRERIGFNEERLRGLLKSELRLSKEDIEKILIFLEK